MVFSRHRSSSSRPKTHSKMRKETTALCLFMVYWNLIFLQINLPKVRKLPPWEHYYINESLYVTSRCKLCDFKADNNGTIPNSSERDAIVTVSFRNLTNLYPFVQSIRTTKCRARIFVFIDKIAAETYNLTYFKRIEDCGVQFIRTDDFEPKFLYDLYYFRYIIYHNFLFANRDKIDRVIAADMYDTVFQHDPFTENFKSDRVYFSNEGYLIKDDDINLKTLEVALNGMKKVNETFSMKDVNYHKLIRNPIVNGGTQAGGILPFISFANFMVRIGNPETLEAFGPDQAFLNLFLHTGCFDGLFKYEIDQPETTFISTLGVFVVDEETRPYGNVKFGDITRGGKKPALIHQYDRSGDLYKSVMNACPNVYNISDYSRNRKNM